MRPKNNKMNSKSCRKSERKKNQNLKSYRRNLINLKRSAKRTKIWKRGSRKKSKRLRNSRKMPPRRRQIKKSMRLITVTQMMKMSTRRTKVEQQPRQMVTKIPKLQMIKKKRIPKLHSRQGSFIKILTEPRQLLKMQWLTRMAKLQSSLNLSKRRKSQQQLSPERMKMRTLPILSLLECWRRHW